MNFAKKGLLFLIAIIVFASIFILPNIFISPALATSCEIASFKISGDDINFEITGISAGNTYNVLLEANMSDGLYQALPTKTYTISDPTQTSIKDKFSIKDINPVLTSDNPGFKNYALAVFGYPTPCNTRAEGPKAGENPCGTECETALGNIPTNPAAFAGKVLTIATGLAGGIAFILMVIGAIRVLTSAGNPQNVSAGRDMIVAALAGLLFLIFSVLILRFIGVEIIDLSG